MNWSVYIVECVDGSYYTGISPDVEKRVETHNSGKGAKYTKARTPVRLLFELPVGTRSQASKVEAKVKKMSRARKAKWMWENRKG